MYDLRNLREMLCKELDEIAEKREMSAGDLDAIQKLTSSIKNTYKIEMLEEGGYSRDGEWEADMRGTYGRGISYRGRHRDSMGRYSRTDAREHMRSTLEDMMREADDDKTRDAIRRCMEQIDRAEEVDVCWIKPKFERQLQNWNSMNPAIPTMPNWRVCM